MKRGSIKSLFVFLVLMFCFFSGDFVCSSPISLQLQNTEVREVLRALAKRLNINLIIDKTIDKSLEKKVSIEIHGLPGDKAFETILAVSGLSVAELSKGVYYVSSAENIKKMKPLKTEYVSLKHISPAEAIQLLNPLPVQAVPLSQGNAVLLNGSEQNVLDAIAFLNQVDKSSENVKIFHLNYSSAAEVAEHLGTLFNVSHRTLGEHGSSAGSTSGYLPLSGGGFGSGYSGGSGTPSTGLQGPSGQLGGGLGTQSSGRQGQGSQGSFPSTGTGTRPRTSSTPVSPGASAQNAAGPVMTIEADETTNSVVVRASPPLLKQVGSVIESLDRKLAQVEVSVEILEVNSNQMHEIGVDWGKGTSTILQDIPAAGIAGSATALVPATPIHLTARTPLQINYIVSWLLEHRAARILANTRVTTLDGKTGVILLGQRYPLVSQLSTAVVAGSSVTSSNVQYVSVGTQFYFTPRIGENGDITLTLHPEVSVITGFSQAFGTQYPILSTRVADSSIIVKDGNTVILGGLIDRELRKRKVRLPFLGDIPLIGDLLFSSRREEVVDTDLVFFITPRIITGNEKVNPPSMPAPLKSPG